MIKFKQKKFSKFVDDAIVGGKIGGAIGTLVTYPDMLTEKVTKFLPGYNKLPTKKKITNGEGKTYSSNLAQKLYIVGAGIAVGATLGALIGATKDILTYIDWKKSGNSTIASIKRELDKRHYRIGEQYTLDPKEADRLGCKVCILVNHDAADLNLIVNTVNDPKLSSIATKSIKAIGGKVKVDNAANNYNKLTLTTISNPSTNAKTVAGICADFIEAGFPVYVLEAGS